MRLAGVRQLTAGLSGIESRNSSCHIVREYATLVGSLSQLLPDAGPVRHGAMRSSSCLAWRS